MINLFFYLLNANDRIILFRIWTINGLKYLVHVTTYKNFLLNQISMYNFSQWMKVKYVASPEIANEVSYLIANIQNYFISRLDGRKH
jgi:hypothetical protein